MMRTMTKFLLQDSETCIRQYAGAFNSQDEELYAQYVSNADAADFLAAQVPRLDCPDKDVELTYHFRWWTYRKHIRRTPEGFVITEFLPDVPWAGRYNTVNLTSCLHMMEGRWLADQQYLDAYHRFWFTVGGNSGPQAYSWWPAWAAWQYAAVTGKPWMATELLDAYIRNWNEWEAGAVIGGYGPTTGQKFQVKQYDNGMFFQLDTKEGSEYTVTGPAFRVLTNASRAGEAETIATMARATGQQACAAEFQQKADALKKCIRERMWHSGLQFFCPLDLEDRLIPARELHGYMPWYFGQAESCHEQAWGALHDPDGFRSPYGLTFVEQRHPGFAISYEGHECLWNGPVWPLASSMTLTAMARAVQTSRCSRALEARHYFDALTTYARSQRRVKENGQIVPWIDENMNPFTGDWIARTRKLWRNKRTMDGGIVERGKDYNHSTFCDLIISGVCGLQPRHDNILDVSPVLPQNAWDYFCLDGVPYHGHRVTLLWDRDGSRYGKGTGFCVWCDGEYLDGSSSLGPLQCEL